MMMMALMAAAATTAFAQDALVKEAKKLMGKGEFDQAAQTLAPALTSSETLDKKGAWNLQSEIMHGKFSAIQTKQIESNVSKNPYDTLGLHTAAIATWEAVLKCDELDQQPDEKGKVKLKYRAAAQTKYKTFGIALVQAGQYFYQDKKDNENAIKAWKYYLDMKNTPIFAEVKDFPKDPFYYDIAYYASILAYQMHNYPDAEKFATLTAEDPSKAGEAMEIMLFSKKESMKTQEDSVAYVKMLKDLHKEDPSEARYFNLLMDYYSHANNVSAMKAWADEEVALDPQNKMAWAVKGEVQMNQSEWDAAVESYKKAIEIDPEFVQCVFNAGVCLNSKAIGLKDQLADKNTGGLKKEDADKVKAILADALTFLERARELDPDSEKVKWAYPLYQIYYALENKEKADEMEKLLNQ
jgi:tetratricopeptide (TPR) repeat protein